MNPIRAIIRGIVGIVEWLRLPWFRRELAGILAMAAVVAAIAVVFWGAFGFPGSPIRASIIAYTELVARLLEWTGLPQDTLYMLAILGPLLAVTLLGQPVAKLSSITVALWRRTSDDASFQDLLLNKQRRRVVLLTPFIVVAGGGLAHQAGVNPVGVVLGAIAAGCLLWLPVVVMWRRMEAGTFGSIEAEAIELGRFIVQRAQSDGGGPSRPIRADVRIKAQGAAAEVVRGT